MLYELGQAEARSWAEEAGFIKPDPSAPGRSPAGPLKPTLESGAAAPSSGAAGASTRIKGAVAAMKKRGRALLRAQPLAAHAGAGASALPQRAPLPQPMKKQ
jgi:hypothetical protein